MADQNPSSSSSGDTPVKNVKWVQVIQIILVSLSLFYDSQQAIISVYTDKEPTWHCANRPGTPCKPTSDICEIPEFEWEWDGPKSSSIISEWGLECSSSVFKGLPTSSFYAGCFAGAIFIARLGDSILGRKNLLVVSCLTMSVSALAAAFFKNLWIYSALRFVSGLGRASIGSSALVLLNEAFANKRRELASITQFCFFASGPLLLPAIAYWNKNSSWRNMFLFTSIPGIVYCVFAHFFIYESPRWLIMQGRVEEAKVILRKMGQFDESLFSHTTPSTKPSSATSKRELFTKGWALKRVLVIMLLSFGTASMLFGLAFGVGNLSFSLYLSSAFNAVLDFPSYFLSFVLLKRFNRRTPILMLSIMSGLCSLALYGISGLGKNILEISLELMSYSCSRVSYAVLMMYTVELFPTSVRNSATSIGRLAIALAGVLCPQLVSAGRANRFFSYGLFGLLILCCGMFVVLLPETFGRALSDTMEEEEEKGNGGGNRTPA